jgi:HK97 family phage major capsid protein
MNSNDIRDAGPADLELRLAEISDELGRLKRHEKPTHAQMQRCDELADEYDACERALRIHRIRAVAANPANRHTGSAPDAFAQEYGRIRGRDPWSAVREAGPFGLSESDLRARALDAVSVANVSDTVRERATVLLEGTENTALAEWALPASDPRYGSAFRKLVRDPLHGHLELDPDERAAFRAARAWQREHFRAMNEGSNASGAFLIPFSLDPAINLTNTGTLGDTVRSLARVDVSATNVHHVITSAGVTAEWTAEAVEAADASPTVSQPTIPLFKADAYLQASFELLSDTNFESDIGLLIADARDRLEASAHIQGNGTSQPRGIITALAATTASRLSASTNGAFGAVDVFNLIGNLPARYHRNAAWLAHPNIGYLIRQMAVGTGATTGTFWQDFAGDNPSTLVGRRWAECSEMTSSLSAATASNDDILVVADFRSFYRIVDHPGASMIYEPLVKGANRRPTGEAGWYVWWRTGGDVVNSDAARLLRI